MRNISEQARTPWFSSKVTNKILMLDPKYNQLLEADSSSEQLNVLKRLINGCESKEILIKLFAILFFHIKPKHPVKCFITKYVSKTCPIQLLFQEELTKMLLLKIKESTCEVNDNDVNILSVLLSCTENFQTGAEVLKGCKIEVHTFLMNCLESFIEHVRITELAPAHKNTIFTHIHNICRALLYQMHKHNDLEMKTLHLFHLLKLLLNNVDVPMDTKSIVGILYVTAYLRAHGSDSWKELVNTACISGHVEQNQNDSIKICLLSALIIVIPLTDLIKTSIGDVCAVSAICDEVMKIDEHSSECSTVLCSTRAMLAIVQQFETSKCHTDVLIDMLDKFLSYVWTHIDHYLDSVRHLSNQILQKIVKVCNKSGGDNSTIKLITNSVLSLPKDRKGYFIGINALVQELGAKVIISVENDLVDILLKSLSVAAVHSYAQSATECLLTHHAKEETSDVIFSKWIRGALECFPKDGVGDVPQCFISASLENIIVKCVKYNEGIVPLILGILKTESNASTITDTDLRNKLLCAKVLRKSAIKLTEICGEDSLISTDLMLYASTHPDSEIRLLVLSVLIETPKTTKMFSREELDIFKHFMEYNVNTQSPSFRQDSLALINKFLARLKDSAEAHKKDRPLGHYYNFILDLKEQCYKNLIPGSNYSRRTIALIILNFVYEFEERFDVVFQDGDLIKRTTALHELVKPLLIGHLGDSFDNNKISALKVLRNPKFYSDILNWSSVVETACSIKPSDCTIAAYQIDYLTYHKHASLTSLIDVSQYDGILQSLKDTEIRYIVTVGLMKILRDHLSIAKESLLTASAKAPMYGLVYCIRHVFQQVGVASISSDEKWTKVIEELIDISFDINSTVGCVVNSSSPEGHLPMDFDSGQIVLHGQIVNLGKGEKVSAQMVLLCSWRSVKEVSLLLSDIASRVLIKEESEIGNITVKQILQVGEHFTILLAETKHRGAFEQAYLGFCSLCSRLWSSKLTELHTLPRRWLEELMFAIQNGDKNGKLCATRRSAGVPFMIQALVTTELQLSGSTKFFDSCIKTLLQLATDETISNIETRTHSLNILRALFRHSKLGDAVNPFLADGLLAAIKGFDASTWAERNSCTLLFSCLVVRIFGVQRNKDSDKLCIRNKMTGRIFFLKYPQLYDFMLDILRKRASNSDDSLEDGCVYPTLLILARLYPSSLEGTVSNLKLVEFIPYIVKCADSRELKTRELAAKAIVSLISPQIYIEHLKALLKYLSNLKGRMNFSHGLILQISRLLGAYPDDIKIGESDSEDLMCGVVTSTWIMDECLSERPCYVTADAYLKMLHLFFVRFPTVQSQQLTENISITIEKSLAEYDETQKRIGKELFLKNAILFKVAVSIKNGNDKLDETLKRYTAHECYEVTIASLDMFLLSNDIIDENDLYLEFIHKNMTSKMHLKRDNEYLRILFNIYEHSASNECREKSLKALAIMDNGFRAFDTSPINDKFTYSIPDFIEKLHDHCLESVGCMVVFLDQYLKETSEVFTHEYELLSHFNEYCCGDSSLQCRENVITLLENHLEIFRRTFNDGDATVETTVEFWKVIVNLIEDDDPYIRQRTSDLVQRIRSDPPGLSCKVLASRASDFIVELIEISKFAMIIFIVLGIGQLYQPKDDLDDDCECRVFDQEEKLNTYIEEQKWTTICFRSLAKCVGRKPDLQFVKHILDEYEDYFNGYLIKEKRFLNDLISDAEINYSVSPKLVWIKHLLLNPDCY